MNQHDAHKKHVLCSTLKARAASLRIFSAAFSLYALSAANLSNYLGVTGSPPNFTLRPALQKPSQQALHKIRYASAYWAIILYVCVTELKAVTHAHRHKLADEASQHCNNFLAALVIAESKRHGRSAEVHSKSLFPLTTGEVYRTAIASAPKWRPIMWSQCQQRCFFLGSFGLRQLYLSS